MEKICLFEHHFVRSYPDYLTFEEELKKKEQFLCEIIQLQKIAKNVQKKCEDTLASNQSRKNASNVLSGKNFEVSQILHSFSQVDSTVCEILSLYIENCSAFAVECFEKVCGCSNGIHIFIETVVFDNYQEICTILRCDLKKQHKLFVHTVVFVNENLFSQYTCRSCSGNNIHRLELQDDFFLKKISDNVLYVSEVINDIELDEQNYFINEKGLKYCALCFKDISTLIQNPLSTLDLNIDKEWLLSVPLEIQELLTTLFINTGSLKRSEHPLKFLQNKLVKLYGIYDSGLNSYNKNYIGILQQLNSQELIVNYHSLATVFEITSHAGCTQSLKASERWLQDAADPDKSYFETYVKRYPLVYKAAGENTQKRHVVSLRECIVILFMDNLVRLTVHEDPDPGQSRTSQICTLPITLKGLPRNTDEVKHWHDESCVADSGEEEECDCLDPNTMEKEDLKLLLQDTDNERQMWEKFSVQQKWRTTSILKSSEGHSIISELKEILNDSKKENICLSELQDLDVSMKSLILDDKTEAKIDDELVLTTTTYPMEEEEEGEEEEEEEIIALDEIENRMETSLKLDCTIEEEQFVQGIDNEEQSKLHLVDTEEESYLRMLSESLVTEELYATEKNCSFNEEEDRDFEGEARYQTNDNYDLKIFKVPQLLCRHPLPATGRDDDISNLKHILQDILIKLGRHKVEKTRILFAPDHKISKNLLKLMKENAKFCQFLPEFPALHLRKSKIVNLFSAYKAAGLLHLLKFMKDSEQEDDWMKLITMQNIETATQNISRLSMALHLAFLVKYLDSLEEKLQLILLSDLQGETTTLLHQKWGNGFGRFLIEGSRNATFALHVDIMQHCDEVVAISVAERIGGPDGYNLLLAAVKRSLPFSFLNGASAYAAFCVDLLNVHYSAGVFHQNMKMSLFSTPHKDGQVNIALDTQREMDHKDAIKGFRPRCTIQSVLPRMTIVDMLTDTQKARQMTYRPGREQSFTDDSIQESRNSTTQPQGCDNVFQMEMAKKDMKHVIPVTKLILRVNALSSEEQEKPRNVYESKQGELQEAVLDKNTYSLGKFLIKRYAVSQGLFGHKRSDCPDINEVEGPKELLRKAKAGKGVTMRRISKEIKNPTSKPCSNELKRQATVKKQTKVLACMSSTMNTCQSLVNPDCTKATVQKSQGIKKALFKALWYTFEGTKLEDMGNKLSEEKLLFVGQIPTDIS